MQDIVNRLLPSHGARPNLELEVRFGVIDNHTKKTVPEDVLNHVAETYNAITPTKVVESIVITIESGNEQYRLHEEDGKRILEKKDRIMVYDNDGLAYRVSLSEETPVNLEELDEEWQAVKIRRRRRMSFVIGEKKEGTGHFVLDVTKVSSFIVTDDEDDLERFMSEKFVADSHEIEVEFIGDKNAVDYDRTWIKNTLEKIIVDVSSIINGDQATLSIENSVNVVLSSKVIGELRSILSHVTGVSQFTTMASIPIEDFKILNLINRPKTMDRAMAHRIKTGYGVTLKADGEFRLIVGTEGLGVIAIDANGRAEQIDTEPSNTQVYPFVAEAEKIGEKYLMYDILIAHGEAVTQLATPDRMDVLKHLFPFSSKQVELKKTLLPNIDFGEGMAIADVYAASDYLISTAKYPIDGIIAVSNGKYWDSIYKQKPPEKTTVDFLATVSGRKVTLWSAMSAGLAAAMRIKPLFPDSYGQLFPSFAKRNKTVFPFPFSGPAIPSINVDQQPPTITLKDGESLEQYSVVECGYDVKKKEWIIMNVRKDKTLLFARSKNTDRMQGPNSYHVALATWNLIHFPVTYDMITGKVPIPEAHFSSAATGELSNIQQFRQLQSHVTHKLLANNIDGKTVLDMASGRGGSMVRLLNQGATMIVEVEPDHAALEEAKTRYRSMVESNQQVAARTKKMNLPVPKLGKVSFVQGNLLEDIKAKIAKEYNKFDVAVCLMALHFFMQNQTTLNTWFRNFNSTLQNGGSLIITCMDGKEVFDFLQSKNIIEGGMHTWYSAEKPPTPTMSITRLYSEDKFLKFGQKIETDVTGLGSSQEYLVNIDHTLIPFMESKGYTLRQRYPFAQFVDSFKQRAKKDSIPISDDQIHFSSLYVGLIFDKSE